MEWFRRAQESGFKKEQAREPGLLCPACGTENEAEAKYCSECGQRLREGQCKFCSAPLKEGAKFCSECGNPVQGVAREAAQSPLPQVSGQERTAQPKEEEQAQQVQEPAKEVKGRVREEQSPRKGFSLGKIDWVLEAVKELAPEGLVGIRAIVAGSFYSFALTEEGDVYAWGSNGCGELGLGDTEDRLTPTKVPGLGRVRAIAAGGGHSLALTESGEVYTWGLNKHGQLGLGDTENRLVPTKVGPSKPTR
jgi:predicted nucleic acid-binding Zn ribbon protein